MNELMMDVHLAGEIKLAARRAGANAKDLKTLAEGDYFKIILPVLRGEAVVLLSKLRIDGDAKPFCPSNWLVKSHRKMGEVEFDPSRIEFWYSEGQKMGFVSAKTLRKETRHLAGVMNANVLDSLLKNTHLIPEFWKELKVFFWGTIYRTKDGSLYVRYLKWDGRIWDWGYFLIGDAKLFDREPAARLRVCA